MLALIDEETLCRGLHLIGQERKIHQLQAELAALQEELDELSAKLAELEK